MGLFSFIKEAGEKLFGGKEAQAATAAAPTQDELNTKAARAIETYIASQNLGASNVQVVFDGTQGKVTVKLPKLTKGKHKISAQLKASKQIAKSTSSKKNLRVR